MRFSSTQPKGLARSRASASSSSVSARIIARTSGRRSGLRNMCSVRHNPIPIAPADLAVRASSAVSAFALTTNEPAAISSAQPNTVSSSSGTTASTSPRPPSTTAPVDPSMEMVSPSDTTTSPTAKWSSAILISSAPQTHGMPHPRATIAAWLTRPPRDVRTPSASAMAATSSGEVSRLTRITDSPRSAASIAASVVR